MRRMINGGLIHSLEFDDTHTASIAHGSAVLAAGALAVAEAQKASGAALLGAYARGWEVLIRFGLAAPNGFHAKGFMSTSVTGTLAVALLAAQLMRLDEDRTLAAIGIALSQASGVMEFLTNGSSVKSLHPGWAAHGGVVAAMLARAGMTGPGNLARRKTRSFPPVHRGRRRRRPLPHPDRRPRPRMAPAESGLQVLSLLPLLASFHRGGRPARRARCARE